MMNPHAAAGGAGKPILLFGAGGLAADVADILARCEATVAGMVVDRDLPPDGERGPLRVFLWEEVEGRADEYAAVNAMGRPVRRAFIEKAKEARFGFLTVIDPSAQVFPSASIGEGCVIGAGAVVAAAARLESHVFLNRGVLVGHHTVLEPFVSVQAGANVGGHGRLREEVEVGIGATIIDRITVGARTMVGAGAVVARDCPADAVMIGVPAKERGR